MNEKVQELINSIGMLAEANKICYETHIKSGFSEEQAMRMTDRFLQSPIRTPLTWHPQRRNYKCNYQIETHISRTGNY